MNIFIFACLLVIGVGASFLENLEVKFQDFKLKHDKIYKNKAEETQRFNIFKENLRSIEQHNALYELGAVSYKQGINKFTDMTREEFKSMLTLSGSNKPHFKAIKFVKTGFQVPDSVDWRTKGQVTEVKDQGDCGSCWAFSLTGSTEAAYYRKSGQLISLSEQQLVDCSTDINYGCNGGVLDKSFPYLQQYGLQSEDSYPYTGKDDSCKYSLQDVVTNITSYTIIDSEDEDALLEAVANVGPITVAIDAIYLSSYESGVYEDKECNPYNLNHAVLAIGYGSENGKDFWIVKNSWGKDFGEQGYVRMARGVNQCGIAEDTVYPIID